MLFLFSFKTQFPAFKKKIFKFGIYLVTKLVCPKARSAEVPSVDDSLQKWLSVRLVYSILKQSNIVWNTHTRTYIWNTCDNEFWSLVHLVGLWFFLNFYFCIGLSQKFYFVFMVRRDWEHFILISFKKISFDCIMTAMISANTKIIVKIDGFLFIDSKYWRVR